VEATLQKITPFLWYDHEAEEASRSSSEGQEFTALNGGPDHEFTDAVSLVVNCEGQDEVDHFWKLLSDGGEEEPCGWLKDRYGSSWQVIPTELPRLLQDTDPGRAHAVMQEMLKMSKIDIGETRASGRVGVAPARSRLARKEGHAEDRALRDPGGRRGSSEDLLS
jgi:predicted 3-demethylubiquinone-9 3-methyltransferase (glyoxalase superfamily)